MNKSRVALILGLCLAALTIVTCCKQTRSTAENTPGSLAPADDGKGTAIKQGITGRVEVWEGNFMPMIDQKSTNNKITPAAGRRVRVHEPLKVGGGMASAKRGEVPTAMVAETMTDSTGQFAVAVPAGTYSIFVEEEGDWYYNGWNGEGIQGAVTVEPDQTSEVLIKITTKATF